MSCDPYKVVRDFEAELCRYTGARFAVTVTSCTMALLLACRYFVMLKRKEIKQSFHTPQIEIPKHTYISVPMAIIQAGGRPTFRYVDWSGAYPLKPFPIWDCARRFYRGMFTKGEMQCVSFHWTKILAIGQGGAILHDNDEADEWLRRARFDGRKEGVAPKDDIFTMIGYHCYMSPRDAAEGLSRLAVLPDNNVDLPNDHYRDLSQLDIFR